MHSRGLYQTSELIEQEEYKQLIDLTNKSFNNAFLEGIQDQKLPAVMIESLKKDMFVFSALKTHAQISEASKLLLDENNKLKPFNSFLQDILKLNKNYNELYLEAEYIFATSSAQMVAKYESLDKSGKYNWQYRTAKDDKVRDSHRALDETTLPPADPFWASYFPPNGWRCRCTVVQVLKDKYEQSNSKKASEAGDKATTLIGASGKNKLEMFRYNPGAKKSIFPPTNPYTKVPGSKDVISMVNAGLLSFTKLKNFKNGGSVFVHDLVDQTAGDFKAILDCANFFASQGSEVKLLPRFSDTLKSDMYKNVFKELKGSHYYGKCPDLQIDGKFYEHEGFISQDKKKAFKNMLNRGLKQSDKIIIEDCGLEESYMTRNINTRIYVEEQNIDEVWIKNGKKLKLIYKNAKTP